MSHRLSLVVRTSAIAGPFPRDREPTPGLRHPIEDTVNACDRHCPASDLLRMVLFAGRGGDGLHRSRARRSSREARRQAAQRRREARHPRLAPVRNRRKPPRQHARGAPQRPPRPAGPTDEDPEEQDFMSEARQAIEDGTLHLKQEEMVAYQHVMSGSRISRWRCSSKRARKMCFSTSSSPIAGHVRFQIVQVDLDVRQVIKCDVKGPGGEEMYEIRGFSPEARLVFRDRRGPARGHARRHRCPGAGLAGGVFLQDPGLLPGGGFQVGQPLRTPMIIGRLDWQPLEAAPSESDPGWIWVAIAGGCVVVGRWPRHWPCSAAAGGRARSARRGLSSAGPTVDQWLDQAQSGEWIIMTNHPMERCSGIIFRAMANLIRSILTLGWRDREGVGQAAIPRQIDG